MVNQQLLDYVRGQLAAGVTKPVLMQAIAGQGWNAQDISEVFATIEGAHPIATPIPTPVPAPAASQPQVAMQPAAVIPAMPAQSAVVPTQPAVAAMSVGEKHTVGAGKRFVNYFIDYLLIVLVGSVAGSVLSLPSTGWIFIVLGLLYFVLFYIFFESIWQRTPAKWMTGTKVVRLDGTKPHFMQIVGRSLCRLIPFELLTFLMGTYAYGWHDRFSGTMVVPKTYSVADAASIDPKQRGKTSVLHIVLIVLLSIGLILGLLAIPSAVVLTSLNSARIQARDAERMSDIKQIQLALEETVIDRYPASLAELASDPSLPVTLPTDPSTHASYVYQTNATQTAYRVCAVLEKTGQPDCVEGTLSNTSASSTPAVQ